MDKKELDVLETLVRKSQDEGYIHPSDIHEDQDTRPMQYDDIGRMVKKINCNRAKSILLAYDLIEKEKIDDVYYLTLKGHRFKSFEDEDRKAEFEVRMMRLNKRQVKSAITTNKSSKRSNFWSPFFAGLAALISLAALAKELIKDKRQQRTIEQFQQQMTQQGNALQIHQTQLNSLSTKVAHLDSASSH